MSNWLRHACVGIFAAAALSSCTLKNANVPPDELMRQFQAGQPMLTCSMEQCGLGWIHDLPNVAALEATGRWQDLAVTVMRIGYGDDLSYYYLGRAAENLGYLQAAQRYYRIAEQLSVTQMSCNKPQVGVNICNGYDFPDALYPHLEVVEARLAALSAPTSTATTQRTPTKRLVRKQPQQTPAASSTAGSAPAAPTGSQTPASGFVVPAPTATSASAASGFVEPAPSSSDPFAPPPVRH
jgi:hypothetical protein